MKLSDVQEWTPPTPVERVGLDGQDGEAYEAFWDRAARVDAIQAISDQDTAESFEVSGRVDAEALRPYLPADGRFLEIGAGIGRVLQHVAPMCAEAHGIDISEQMVARGRARLAHLANVRLHHGNGYDLEPFDDGVFDALYCAFVFQHMPKTTVFNYLLEAHRVLKPDGVFRFQVPNLLVDGHFLAFQHFSMPYFVRHPFPMYFYTPAEVIRLTTKAGFWIEDLGEEIVVVARKRPTPGIAPELAAIHDTALLRARVAQLTGDLERVRNHPAVRVLRRLRRALPGA
jgi:ubiquinone/menaquinone biosynthesis C-methylase UbiE